MDSTDRSSIAPSHDEFFYMEYDRLSTDVPILKPSIAVEGP